MSKHVLRLRYEQLLYWSAIGIDVVTTGPVKGVYVLGYIKSGTNWLCHLLSDAMDIPINEPWKRNIPCLPPCIFHMHRFIPLKSVRKRTVYISRDGRDVMVSAYYHVVREGGTMKNRFEKYIGASVTAEQITENMPAFIRFMSEERIATIDWKSHIEKYLSHRDDFVFVRYEELLGQPEESLSRILAELGYENIDIGKVYSAVQNHEFSKKTGRKRGVSDENSFLRKGISGDWKNYFNEEAEKVFKEYAGDFLLKLGYE